MGSSSNESEISYSSDSESDNENQIHKYMQSLLQSHQNRKKVKLDLLKQLHVESSQRVCKRSFVERKRELDHQKLVADYFADHPTYTNVQFRRRFRMQKHVFLRIVESLQNEVTYFKPKVDATGRASISPLIKCTAALRVLAYGLAFDQVDEYLRIGESTTRLCLMEFVSGIISIFGENYLRRPTEEDLRRLLLVGEERGFPGMLGSIDCMHWEWKNCPIAWQGQFAGGHKRKPTIVLKAVASNDLWFWHAFFGTPGRAPPVRFNVNNHEYDMGYYLTDGIYPPWATIVQSISHPQDPKSQLFAQHQESARKDVERAFGVLQARFAVVRDPCKIWDAKFIGKIMRACIILHNMIVEDERDTYSNYHDPSQWEENQNIADEGTRWTYSRTRINDMETYIQNQTRVRNTAISHSLKFDLVESIWQKFGTRD